MSRKARDILIIGDAWDTLDHPVDSSLHLTAVGAREFGVRSFWAHPDQLFLANGKLSVQMDGEVRDKALVPLPEIRQLDSFHSVHWRADPPVTLATYRLWSLLEAAGNAIRFFNKPAALLSWNEKFAPSRWRSWAVPSVVASYEEPWRELFARVEKSGNTPKIIAKPAGDAASRGVIVLPAKWEDARGALHAMQANHGAWLVLQEFDELVFKKGETRVFILAGKPVQTLKKTPRPGISIMNLDAAPSERPLLELGKMTAVQKKRSEAIGRFMKTEGVMLATIDFIGDRVLEINVTSPGLIHWVDEQTPARKQLARKYWEQVLKQ